MRMPQEVRAAVITLLPDAIEPAVTRLLVVRGEPIWSDVHDLAQRGASVMARIGSDADRGESIRFGITGLARFGLPMNGSAMWELDPLWWPDLFGGGHQCRLDPYDPVWAADGATLV